MPCDSRLYPREWPTIRAAILHRAQHCCEGSPAYPGCRAQNHEPHPVTGSRVVLTIAHRCRCLRLCGNPAHLAAWCQRCHLTADSTLHVQHAAATRMAAKEAQGQLRLFA